LFTPLFPLQYCNSPHTDNSLFSFIFILASCLWLWMSLHLILIMWCMVLISVSSVLPYVAQGNRV
jgi:hypothetical protein